MPLSLKLPRILLLTAAMQLVSGCLNSPLLNHADADDVQQPSNDGNPPCALVFPKQDLCASLTWIREQDADTQGEFELRFWRRGEGTEFGPYVDPGYPVSVKLWMASMGHGSAPVTVNEIATGVYSATNVYFVMPGPWEIWVQLKSGSTIVERAKIDYVL